MSFSGVLPVASGAIAMPGGSACLAPLEQRPYPEFTFWDRLSDESAEFLRVREKAFKFHVEGQKNWGLAPQKLQKHHVSEKKLAHIVAAWRGLPAPIRDLLNDKQKFMDWAIQLRDEVVQEMIRDGKASLADLENPKNWEYYVDNVLLAHAIANGFSNPYRHHRIHGGLTPDEFFRVQRDKIFFDDVAGARIVANVGFSRVKHHRRGHAFQNAYASDVFDGYVEYYSSLGKSQDPMSIWDHCFDNPYVFQGLSSPGRVVEIVKFLMPISE